jgi:hypothetical protein
VYAFKIQKGSILIVNHPKHQRFLFLKEVYSPLSHQLILIIVTRVDTKVVYIVDNTTNKATVAPLF